MKKVVIGIIAVVVLLIFVGGCGGYNGLVTKDEDVKAKWNQVETQYQRRADLIPNLVETVKGAVKAEEDILTSVMEARAKATSVTIDPTNLTPENIAKYQSAQGSVTQALKGLLVLQEKYPELKSIDQFRDVSAELAGTENRIAVARKDFNESVQTYNSSVRSFPTNLTAGILGFKPKEGFKADAGAENAPKVKF